MVYLAVAIIGIPLLIFVIETFKKLHKHFMLKKVFNLKRELKNTKEKAYKPALSKTADIEKTFLGVSSNQKDIYMPNNAKHVFVCGTTGSGKTAALSNFIKSAVDNNYPALIVDGKGDTGAGSLLDIA
jgi:HrpA-like RNA helicase